MEAVVDEDPEYQSDAYLHSFLAWPYELQEHLDELGELDGGDEEDRRTSYGALNAGVVVVQPPGRWRCSEENERRFEVEMNPDPPHWASSRGQSDWLDNYQPSGKRTVRGVPDPNITADDINW